MLDNSPKAWVWWLNRFFTVGLALLELYTGIIGQTVVLGEIIPDTSLGNESSLVQQGVDIRGEIGNRIDGGAVRGANLFHSFIEFNVENGQRVYFSNPNGVQNIITRVIGKRSDILGTLGVLGNSNLFLINPNGIVFGANARLDIAGSFVASTADSLVFDNGFAFSATNPQAPPLLTINVPLGLQFGATPASIVNQSRATNINGEVVGLQVQPGKTLALVGGDIDLQGGSMTAEGGRIELGAIAQNGLARFNLSSAPEAFPISLSYKGIQSFQDIKLSRRSEILANSDSTTEMVSDVQLQGRRVTITEESGIFARNRGSGLPGSVTVNASDVVELIGGSPINQDSLINVSNSGSGAGSNVIINTSRLIVRDGAYIAATTAGAGRGGNITVNALESVELIGTTLDSQFGSGLFSQVRRDARGDGGSITVNTRRLSVRNGAQVSTPTFAAGQGGKIVVKASESVEVSGRTPDGQNVSSLTARSALGATGSAGSVLIETGQLLVQNGAKVSVSSLSSGNPGNLELTAHNILLDQGSVEALTTSGTDGNIVLKVADYILIRNGSLINARALNNGNGGNINIDTNFVIAVTKENSDIIANAFEGSGGRINIKAQSIFGLAPRDTLTPLSDINASSELGVDGVVNINTPDVDPSRGLVALPTNLVDASQQIAQNCSREGRTASQQSEFVITGRGGLPPNPSEPLSSDAVWEDLQFYTLNSEVSNDAQIEKKRVSPPPPSIIEAQGWTIDTKGNVTLIAHAPTTTSHTSDLTPVSCPTARN
ncbi:hypothetical protein BZZ01_19570 [Nostocales cyanobacterium HT-58-2]|nr:hypothetical protein BZZ01_19570 [Nostocales cyanobacterium HT-58-2]